MHITMFSSSTSLFPLSCPSSIPPLLPPFPSLPPSLCRYFSLHLCLRDLQVKLEPPTMVVWSPGLFNCVCWGGMEGWTAQLLVWAPQTWRVPSFRGLSGVGSSFNLNVFNLVPTYWFRQAHVFGAVMHQAPSYVFQFQSPPPLANLGILKVLVRVESNVPKFHEIWHRS